MPGKWYYTRDGRQRLGPFTFEQLRKLAASKKLKPSHLVLRDGSKKWMPARSINGLFPPTVEVIQTRSRERPDDEPSDAQDHDTSKPRTLGIALMIVGGLLVAVGIPLLFQLSADPKTLQEVMEAVVSLLIILAIPCGIIGAIVGLVFLISYVEGTSYACPECGKGWARIQIGEKVIERKKCYGLVTRRAYSSSSGSSFTYGNRQSYSGSSYSSGSTSWKERVPVIRTTYLLIYGCKYCDARWTREEVEQVEDFEIER